MPDFRALYYGARCADSGENPYDEVEYLARYRSESGKVPTGTRDLQNFLQAIPFCVNPPSTLLFVVPFTWLGWAWAHFIWLFIMIASLDIGAFLVWEMASEFAPRLSLVLVAFLMANCESLLKLGNVSACVIGWSAFAVWTFRKQRLEVAGMLALAVSLALKPQVAGVIWLFCFLIDKFHRKRAIQSFGVALLFLLLSVGWISRISLDWMRDWKTNMTLTSARGSINDPGPLSTGNHSVNRIISLQTVFARVVDNALFYDTAAMVLCALLLIAWFYYYRRASHAKDVFWIGLASFVPLTLLPVYHRQYDAKLLLLIIPACALLWKQEHRYRKFGLSLTVCLLAVSADIPGAILAIFAEKLRNTGFSTVMRPLIVLIENPIPICMLVLGCFYLLLMRRETLTSVAAE